MKRICFALAAIAPFGIACGNGNGNLPPPPPPPPPTVASAPPPVASVETTADAGATEAPPPPAPKAPDVNLTLGTAAPDPKPPTPTVHFAAPTKGQVIDPSKVDDFEVKLDVKNWKTAHCDAHVHVILDNHEYKAIYDTKAPIHFKDLLKAGETLGEGQHVLVAFPSRATHESVKTPGALVVQDFWVGKKKGTPTVDLAKPMLIYSRPKGAYKGDMANHVLVDFQLANAKLEEGKQTVRITVNGPGADNKTAEAVKFGPPFYLDNLSDGSYTVKLELLGADKQPVPGPWNSTERTITVDHSATPDCTPGAPAGGH